VKKDPNPLGAWKRARIELARLLAAYVFFFLLDNAFLLALHISSWKLVTEVALLSTGAVYGAGLLSAQAVAQGQESADNTFHEKDSR
jgi:hypothetical protein